MRGAGIALGTALMVLGCAARQPRDTLDEALEQAAGAMTQKDAPALYGMLDEKLRVGMNEESLSNDLDRNESEYAELASLIASPTKIEFRALVEVKGGGKLDFVLEGESWKLATPVMTDKSATDPIQALSKLADKLEALRKHMSESGLLAQQHEKGFLQMLEKMAAEIRQIRPEDLVLAEDRCYVNLPSGRKIELVREGEVWKVSSIFPAIEFK